MVEGGWKVGLTKGWRQESDIHWSAEGLGKRMRVPFDRPDCLPGCREPLDRYEMSKKRGVIQERWTCLLTTMSKQITERPEVPFSVAEFLFCAMLTVCRKCLRGTALPRDGKISALETSEWLSGEKRSYLSLHIRGQAALAGENLTPAPLSKQTIPAARTMRSVYYSQYWINCLIGLLLWSSVSVPTQGRTTQRSMLTPSRFPRRASFRTPVLCAAAELG